MGTDTDGRPVNDAETAGVIARPPFLFLGAVLLGLVWDFLLPLPFLVPGSDLVHWIIGGALILIGLTLAVAGIRNFSRAGTPVEGTSLRARWCRPGFTAGPAIRSISACF